MNKNISTGFDLADYLFLWKCNSVILFFSSANDPSGEDAEDEDAGTRETVLHLYIPDHTSPLLTLIQRAWNSCIMVS